MSLPAARERRRPLKTLLFDSLVLNFNTYETQTVTIYVCFLLLKAILVFRFQWNSLKRIAYRVIWRKGPKRCVVSF